MKKIIPIAAACIFIAIIAVVYITYSNSCISGQMMREEDSCMVCFSQCTFSVCKAPCVRFECGETKTICGESMTCECG